MAHQRRATSTLARFRRQPLRGASAPIPSRRGRAAGTSRRGSLRRRRYRSTPEWAQPALGGRSRRLQPRPHRSGERTAPTSWMSTLSWRRRAEFGDTPEDGSAQKGSVRFDRADKCRSARCGGPEVLRKVRSWSGRSCGSLCGQRGSCRLRLPRESPTRSRYRDRESQAHDHLELPCPGRATDSFRFRNGHLTHFGVGT